MLMIMDLKDKWVIAVLMAHQWLAELIDMDNGKVVLEKIFLMEMIQLWE